MIAADLILVVGRGRDKVCRGCLFAIRRPFLKFPPVAHRSYQKNRNCLPCRQIPPRIERGQPMSASGGRETQGVPPRRVRAKRPVANPIPEPGRQPTIDTSEAVTISMKA